MGFSLKVFRELPVFNPSGNFYTFLVCLFLAITFWLLNALTKNYTTRVEAYLGLKKVPKNFIVTQTSHPKIVLEVTGHGFNLLTLGGLLTDSFYLDVAPKINLEYQQTQKIKIPQQSILAEISASSKAHYQIQKVITDSFYIELQPKLTRKILVKPNFNLSVKPGYVVEKIKLHPAFLSVTGPKSIVEKIDTLFTEPKNFNLIDADLNFLVKIIVPNQVQVPETKTNVSIDVKAEKIN